MILSDYHVHCNFSSDSDTSMEKMIEQAIYLGLERICFTDHMDYCFPEQYEYRFVFSAKDYLKKIAVMQKKYPQIEILKGVECGMQPGISKMFNQLAGNNSFDFMISSCHVLDNMDPYYKEFWNKYSAREGVYMYFKTILSNINEFKNYDVCGHLDYIVRYCPPNFIYQSADFMDIIDEILKTLIENGKGIEANTSGLKYGLNMMHPCNDILKRYKELGGEILTIGSDAHQPDHLAYDFPKALQMLKSFGFRYYTIFKERKPQFIALV